METRFTQSYSQPESYRFCQDSVLAPMHIARDLARWFSPSMRVLDLGAGCGVMGLELAHALPDLMTCDFLEIQSEFRRHFDENRGVRTGFRFVEGHWSGVEVGAYDVVIANPPYFDVDESSLGPDEMSNRCRFFLDDSFQGCVRAARSALKPGGRAYLLVKSGEEHGRDSMTLLRTIAWDCEVSVIADVRGTSLVKIVAP